MKGNFLKKCSGIFLAGAMILNMTATQQISAEQKYYCGQEEHTHDESCYAKTLICMKTDPEHEHTDDCYAAGEELKCVQEEHQHTADCAINPNKVEDRQWLENLPDISNETAAKAIAMIAESQVGYDGAADTNLIDEDQSTNLETGNWSRFGALYGNAAEEWSYDFIRFVLEYSNVDANTPDSQSAWLEANEKYLVAEDAENPDPAEGDIVLIKNLVNEEDRLAVVTEMDANQFKAVTGNFGGKVEAVHLHKEDIAATYRVASAKEPETNGTNNPVKKPGSNDDSQLSEEGESDDPDGEDDSEDHEQTSPSKVSQIKGDDPADAYVTQVLLKSTVDGTAPFDENDARGNDSSAENKRVRSNDTITYNLEVSVGTYAEDGETLTIDDGSICGCVMLPYDPEVYLDKSAMGLPEIWNEEKITVEGKEYRKYTFDVEMPKENGRPIIPGAVSIPVVVSVRNKHENDKIVPQAAFRFEGSNKEVEPQGGLPVITVTSNPKYNVKLVGGAGNISAKNEYQIAMGDGQGTKKVTGYEVRFGAAIEIRNDNYEAGMRGTEKPDLSKDFSFQLDLSSWVLETGTGTTSQTDGYIPIFNGIKPNGQNNDYINTIPFGDRDGDNSILSNDVEWKQDGSIVTITVKGKQGWTSADDIHYPTKNVNGKSLMIGNSNVYREAVFGSYFFTVILPVEIENGDLGDLSTSYSAGNINLKVQDKNMQITSVTNTISSAQTYAEDDELTVGRGFISGEGRHENQIFYSNSGSLTEGSDWSNNMSGTSNKEDGSDSATLGQELCYTIFFEESGIGSADWQRRVIAYDQLVKIDDEMMDLSQTQIIRATKSEMWNYKVLYAYKEDGTGWTDNNEMKAMKEEDLVYSDHLIEGKPCVGLLYQFRGANLPADKDSFANHVQQTFKVKENDEILNRAFMITITSNAWTSQDLMDNEATNQAAQEWFAAQGITKPGIEDWANYSKANWNAAVSLENDSKPINSTSPSININHDDEYVWTVYDENGYTGNETKNWLCGDTLYIVPYTMWISKTVAQQDQDGNPELNYNLDSYQRVADYVIGFGMEFTQEVQLNGSWKTVVTVKDTLPKGLKYMEGSSYFGGEYVQNKDNHKKAPGTIKGGQPVTPESVTENSDGTTTIVWELTGVDVVNGALPNLYYSCQIGDSKNAKNDVTDLSQLNNVASVQSTQDHRKVCGNNHNQSQTSITVSKRSAFNIAKDATAEIEADGEGVYNLSVNNSSMVDHTDLVAVDIMPTNGRSGTIMNGEYIVTQMVLDKKDYDPHFEKMHVYFTDTLTEEMYSNSFSITKDVVENWYPAEISEDGTIDSENPEEHQLLGTWPVAIAIVDENLKAMSTDHMTIHFKGNLGDSNGVLNNSFQVPGNKLYVNAQTKVFTRSISGYTWFDNNRDGVFNENDQDVKISGVVTTLLKDGKTIATTKTDQNGYYEFKNLKDPSKDGNIQIPESSDNTNQDEKKTNSFVIHANENYKIRFALSEDDSGESWERYKHCKVVGKVAKAPDVMGNTAEQTKTLANGVNQVLAPGEEVTSIEGVISHICMPEIPELKTKLAGLMNLAARMFSERVSVNPSDSTSSHYDLPDQNFAICEPQAKVEVEKIWNDNDNQDGLRKNPTFRLYRNGNPTDKKEELKNGETHVVFDHLPAYQNGEKIIWTVQEENTPEKYGMKISHKDADDPTGAYEWIVDADVTNKHEPEKMIISVTKTWDDNNNQNQQRPGSVTIYLLKNGSNVERAVVLSEDNNWTYRWDDLDVYSPEGVKNEWSVMEHFESSFYTSTASQETSGESAYNNEGMQISKVQTDYTVANKYVPETVTISGNKIWDDKDNQDGIRPAGITIRVSKTVDDVETVVSTYQVTPDPNGAWEIRNLPKYENGKEIEYSIAEVAIEGYTAKIIGFSATNNYVITNTHVPGTVVVKGTKVWDDEDNQDGIRPASITVLITSSVEGREDKTEEYVVTPDDTGNWSVSNLPENENGKKVTYTVHEKQVKGYEEPVISGSVSEGFTITNTHEPESTDIKGTKTWNDNDDQDHIRPNKIKIALTKIFDGNAVPGEKHEVELDEEGNWTISGLPKYERGKKIYYLVDEVDVEGYTKSVSGTDITNTHEPGTIAVKGKKIWVDNDNQDGIRPHEITILLTRKVGEEEGTITEHVVVPDEAGNWSISNLPEKEDGIKITYTVNEKQVPGYEEPVVTGTAEEGFIITNAHTPEFIELKGTKTWKDNDNQDGIRPKKIKVALTKIFNGNAVPAGKYEVQLDEAGNWTIPNLPKFEEGKKIYYQVDEVDVEGYSKSVSGTDIVNTHVPGTIVIKGTKTWVDNDDQDRIRPLSITILLTSKVDGREDKITEHKVIPDEEGNWSISNLPDKENGKVITYVVDEKPVPGYDKKVDGTDITNTHVPTKPTNPGNPNNPSNPSPCPPTPNCPSCPGACTPGCNTTINNNNNVNVTVPGGNNTNNNQGGNNTNNNTNQGGSNSNQGGNNTTNKPSAPSGSNPGSSNQGGTTTDLTLPGNPANPINPSTPTTPSHPSETNGSQLPQGSNPGTKPGGNTNSSPTTQTTNGTTSSTKTTTNENVVNKNVTTETTKSSTVVRSAGTSANSNVWIWAALLAISGLMLGLGWKKYRTHK